ncbi:hypothetical protein K504DRAFT_352139, partial [Pleomassaria siparia CBS 279.74]
PPKGQFLNGIWNCRTGDCNPRQPAIHFQTKKEGQNKGRWFYSCQRAQSDKSRCKFFLWDDDAKPREERALLNNSRTEPAYTNPNTPSKPYNAPQAAPPPYTPTAAPEQSRKRNRPVSDEDDEFDCTQGEDAAWTNELDLVMAASETRRKCARTEAFTTPARRKLPWAKDDNQPTHGLQTPQTERRAPPTDPFPTRFAAPGGSFLTPSKFNEEHNEDSHQTLTPASSPFDTPTPSRFKDVGPTGKEDVVREVFSLLHNSNVGLSNQTQTELKNILSKYTRRSEGFRKGHELVRLSVKTKEAQIKELEYRIAILESGQEEEHA